MPIETGGSITIGVLIRRAALAGIAAAALAATPAFAQKTKLTVYTALENDQLDPFKKAFEADNRDIEIVWIRDSTGVLTSRILAEQDRQRGDAVWGLAVTSMAIIKQRGLLEDTLVVWCTEFGRMPFFQKGSQGRDHNPDGFTCWLTGAGVQPGVSHGVTDDLGRRAIVDVHPLYDFNATILHLLGLNHEKLTYYHNGVRRRLTDVHGHVVQPILS